MRSKKRPAGQLDFLALTLKEQLNPKNELYGDDIKTANDLGYKRWNAGPVLGCHPPHFATYV
tara:strand:- start:16717 stop:16902 length:186 start_codon:yes stop_codon:yes gene_type:complete